MPNNLYNTNFLETPDPVTGLQRRTGQNFLDVKQTIHERRTLEHNYDPDETSPQNKHGIHRQGSAVAYVTESGDPLPSDRPTGKDKNGVEIPALALDENDDGRICWDQRGQMQIWDGDALVWRRLDTTPVGMVNLWPNPTATPDPYYWAKCNGQDLVAADYPVLETVLGSSGGSITLPDMQGVGVSGSGTLDFPDNGDPDQPATGRVKGDSTTIGHYREDRIQTLEGVVDYYSLGTGNNIVRTANGIFRTYTGASDTDSISRSFNNNSRKGFQIDLDNADVRNGETTRGTSMVLDYYMKIR